MAAVNHVGQGEMRELPEPAQAVDRLIAPQVDIDASFKQTHIVKAGASVCLGVHFRGKPIPSAAWVRDEGELGVMTEVQTTDGYSSLSIENCTRSDSGKYTVNLENSSGSKAITFTVKVPDVLLVTLDEYSSPVSSLSDLLLSLICRSWTPPVLLRTSCLETSLEAL